MILFPVCQLVMQLYILQITYCVCNIFVFVCVCVCMEQNDNFPYCAVFELLACRA